MNIEATPEQQNAINLGFFRWVVCPHCGLANFAAAPHGPNPCPDRIHSIQHEQLTNLDLSEFTRFAQDALRKLIGELGNEES